MKVKIQKLDDSKSVWFIRKYKNTRRYLLRLNEVVSNLDVSVYGGNGIEYKSNNILAFEYAPNLGLYFNYKIERFI